MKILFTLIFLLPNFYWPVSLSQKTNLTVIKNDEVEFEHKRTLDFDLKEQMQTTLSQVSRKTLGLTMPKAELDKVSKAIGSIQQNPLNLEISKDLFYDLQNYIGFEIEYYLDYLTLVEWKNPVKSQEYRLVSNFQLVHGKELLVKPTYDDLDEKSFLITEHNLPTSIQQHLIIFRSVLALTQQNKKFYLSFLINLGLSLFHFRPVFYEDGGTDFLWRTTTFLKHLKIIIREKIFDFTNAKTDSITIYYQANKELNLKLLQQNYWWVLENKRFKFWQEAYPNVTFDFLKFKKNYHFNAFNKNLIVNKLSFKLDLVLPTKHSGAIVFCLIIIKCVEVRLELDTFYEVNANEFQKWLKQLNQQIVNQGYDLVDFSFKIFKDKVIISSQNPDYFFFEPIEINYKLIENGPSSNSDKDDELEIVDEPEKKLIIKKSNFNQKYFYWLFLPVGFLLIYLALLFWKKPKYQKH